MPHSGIFLPVLNDHFRGGSIHFDPGLFFRIENFDQPFPAKSGMYANFWFPYYRHFIICVVENFFRHKKVCGL